MSDAFRRVIVSKLIEILTENNVYNLDNVNKMIKLEDTIFKENNNVYKYKDTIRHYYNNLNPNGYVQNKNFLNVFLQQNVSVRDVLRMSPQQIFPERWTDVVKKLSVIQKESMFYTVKSDVESMLKCGKCKQKKVEYTELQTRSADEPMTKFCYCSNCGFRWKM